MLRSPPAYGAFSRRVEAEASGVDVKTVNVDLLERPPLYEEFRTGR